MTGNEMILMGMGLLKKSCSIKFSENGCCGCRLRKHCDIMYVKSLEIPTMFELRGEENDRQ